ncbi:unnamed protein product [Spodoptera littoralis]|uniref:Apyrase n=1 Tax=Spodoptera littoralis TaxID=7109 RepID=A0A9P0N5U7_SPOLI|nr:unnamed protein product [Spodoptera littoralis]CAH1640966.1 unnamed protein product [Spodoptera littoralis]
MFALYSYLLCLCLWTANSNVLRGNDLYQLDIVHYNDFHDRFEETSVIYPTCASNDTSCLGGFARLYQEIQTLLKERPGALLLNAGDTFQGTYWYTLLKWNVTQRFINMLPNDAHALGNHEFDDGIPGLLPYIRAMKAPVLAANLASSNETGLNSYYQPHVVVERKGRKIGIIGLITKSTELLSNAEGVTFLEPIPVVQKEAQLLTDQGVDIIIVLSHCGLEVDKQIAKQVGENIDIIVGGHSHSLLWNGEAPSKEKVSGPYPVMVESEAKPGHQVLVVTASAYTKYLGNMTAYFDNAGELKSFEGSPVFLNRSIPEDPEIKALLQPYTEELHKIVNEVVGSCTDDMEMDSCAYQECALGNFIAEAFLNISHDLHPTALPSISFLQRSMVRSSLLKGDITKGSIINISPFTNRMVTFVISGIHIVEAMERSVMFPWRPKPYTGPYTPHFSGVKVTINTTSHEVVDMFFRVGDKYEKFDVNRDYQVTTLDFLTRGGNGFAMFKEHGRNMTVLGVDRDILERYVRKASPIVPHLDKRLTLVS